MVEMMTMRIWMGVTLAWPLLWILVFDRWFFWTPIGLFIAFGIPIAGWALWWNFYRGEEQKILADGRKVLADGRQVLDRTIATLRKLKKSNALKIDKKKPVDQK